MAPLCCGSYKSGSGSECCALSGRVLIAASLVYQLPALVPGSPHCLILQTMCITNRKKRRGASRAGEEGEMLPLLVMSVISLAAIINIEYYNF